MVRILINFCLFILSLGMVADAFANSCCGQSPASYLVLYQHQKYSISPSLTYTQSLGRVYGGSEDFYVWSGDKERNVQLLNLNAAAHVSESSQIFLSSGYLQGTYQEDGERARSGHFSDTLLGYSYEVLPEYTYSSWKPVVYLSALVNLPTGHSIYDKSALSEGADVSGHAQWGTGVGITMRKVYFPVTLLVQAKTLRLFAEEFQQVKVSSFYDTSLAGFATYATRYWDISATAGATWNHLSSRELSTSSVSSGTSRVTTVILSVQKPLSDEVSLSLAYSDQSLLGNPQNTLLNRSYTMNISYNYF